MNACLRVTIAGAALLTLPGCATVAMNAAMRAAYPHPPWNGEVVLASEPPGARCAIHRGDTVVAEVAAAPGTIQLTRSHAMLEVRCRADGYIETAEAMRPIDDPAVFRMAPNGIIGATATVISLASARTMRYPGQVTIAMVPATFRDEDARAQFFEARRGAILATRAAQLALADERCRAQADTTCDPTAMVLRQEQADDLARLDRMRAQAQVSPDAARATGVQVAVADTAR